LTHKEIWLCNLFYDFMEVIVVVVVVDGGMEEIA